MQWRKVSSPKPVVDFLARAISGKLNSGKKVLWLATGGSTAELAVQTARRLDAIDLSNLTVSLIDERYGPIGHKDSNWELLQNLGLKLHGARLEPILRGQDFRATVEQYRKFLSDAIQNNDYKIALMGIGPDSHIAGIKPNSPAINEKRWAVGYDWDDYKGRITMSFAAIRELDCSISYLLETTKKQAIENLQADLPLNDCPSQILKQVKQAIIFNDMIGEVG